jgi:hypothetical protein
MSFFNVENVSDIIAGAVFAFLVFVLYAVPRIALDLPPLSLKPPKGFLVTFAGAFIFFIGQCFNQDITVPEVRNLRDLIGIFILSITISVFLTIFLIIEKQLLRITNRKNPVGAIE